MDEAEIKTLADVLRPNAGISYGIVQPGTPLGGGVPIIRVSDVKNGRIATESPLRVHPDIEAKHQRTRLKGGELLITIVGSVGEMAIVPVELSGWNVARAIAVLPIREDIGADWVKLALSLPEVRSQIDSRLNTTVQATLNLRDLAELPVFLPPLEVRTPIIDCIGAIERKIELNRSTNETLEAMAKAIFKDWFIDFGPTRAKMEGKEPYLASELWALFPDRLNADDVPDGWKNACAAELIEFNPPAQLKPGMIAPYLDMAALPISGSQTQPPIMREFASGTKFQNGDALLARITPCLENGKAAFVQNLPDKMVGWGSTEFIVMRARPPMPKSYAYILARSASFKEKAIQSMSGTSGRQRVQLDQLAQHTVVCPTDEIAEAFGGIVEPFFDSIAARSIETAHLSSMRDLLLPKLMSGEIRLKDAEKAVEAVM